MAHRIFSIRKKPQSFPQAANKNDITELIKDIDNRLTVVEEALKELTKKA